jgi:hypothetical protein
MPLWKYAHANVCSCAHNDCSSDVDPYKMSRRDNYIVLLLGNASSYSSTCTPNTHTHRLLELEINSLIHLNIQLSHSPCPGWAGRS